MLWLSAETAYAPRSGDESDQLMREYGMSVYTPPYTHPAIPIAKDGPHD